MAVPKIHVEKPTEKTHSRRATVVFLLGQNLRFYLPWVKDFVLSYCAVGVAKNSLWVLRS